MMKQGFEYMYVYVSRYVYAYVCVSTRARKVLSN